MMSKAHGIRKYLTWLTLVPLLVMAITMGSYALLDRYADMDRDLLTRGQLISRQLAASSEYGVFSNNRTFLNGIAASVLREPDVRSVIVLDGASRILAAAGEMPSALTGVAGKEKNSASGSGLPIAMLKPEQLLGLVNREVTVFDKGDAVLLYQPIMSTQIELDEVAEKTTAQQIGAVIIEMNWLPTRKVKSDLFWFRILATSALLLVTLYLVHLASRRISFPIRKLSEAVQAIGDGNLETRVALPDHVFELSNLADGINAMVVQLQLENAMLHQRAEEATRLSAIAFKSHEGMMITDADREIVMVNDAFTETTGYPAGEAVGRTPSMLSSGRHDDAFYAAMWEAIHRTGIWQGELWNRHKSGAIYPEKLTITAVKNKEGAVTNYVGVFHDITERKLTEEKLLHTMRQLEEQGLAKTRFLAVAGHDLRQPVAAATLFVEALKLSAATERQSEMIDGLDQSMKTFSSLLERLLDISKFDAGAIKPQISELNLTDIFNWLEHNFATTAHNKQLRFCFFFPTNTPLVVRTDIGLLQSVLMNLVSNAIKFTTRGGILISARMRGDKVLLQVWDTGIGIAEENITDIFKEFYQVANVQRNREVGLGLGLSICQRAMSLLACEFTCRSRVGRGTVFSINLPLNTRPQQVEPLASSDKQIGVDNQMLVQGKQIVVLEDDALVAAAIGSLLQGLGAEVRHFFNAEEALQHDDAIANTDFFIVDYALGGELTGLQYLETLQQRRQAHIRAVVITGETSSQFISSIATIPWPVLHKPVNFAKLAAILRSVNDTDTPAASS